VNCDFETSCGEALCLIEDVGEWEEGVFSELLVEYILPRKHVQNIVEWLHSSNNILSRRLITSKAESDGA
jgi:hypothetical protein